MERQVREGDRVLGPDGATLGRVERLEADCFVVRRGHVLAGEFDVEYVEVVEVVGEYVLLRRDPTVFSEADAKPGEKKEPPVTGAEAGYDFGSGREESSLDSDRPVSKIEAGVDFGGWRKGD